MAREPPATLNEPLLETGVGRAVKRDRLLKGMTMTQLSDASGISTAMISKIERGQVSASLNTLGAIARAIDVPLVNFLADLTEQTDISHVRAGAGMEVRREGETFAHVFRQIGRAHADDVQLRVYLIELDAYSSGEPLLSHPGIEFIHVLEGSISYRCGRTCFDLQQGDSLTFETRTPHGPAQLLSDRVVLLTAIAEPYAGG